MQQRAQLDVGCDFRDDIDELHLLTSDRLHAFNELGALQGQRALARHRFEQLQIIPLLIITPLTFLGGTFYSTHVLPPFWQTVTLFNPVVYLISGFRWSFFEIADVSPMVSLGMTLVFLCLCLVTIWWIFKTGYRLKK